MEKLKLVMRNNLIGEVLTRDQLKKILGGNGSGTGSGGGYSCLICHQVSDIYRCFRNVDPIFTAAQACATVYPPFTTFEGTWWSNECTC